MRRTVDRVALIDFAAGVPTPHVAYAVRLPLGSVTLSRCIFPPSPGVTLGSKQAIVAVHSYPSFELEWWDPSRDPLQRTTIKRGEMNVNAADLPVFHRWTVPAKALKARTASTGCAGFVFCSKAERSGRRPRRGSKIQKGMY